MIIKKDIEPISFNHHRYCHIEVEESARKHYGGEAVPFFERVASTLDDQMRTPDETNRLGESVFHVASCTSFTIEGRSYQYRDTMFKEYPNRETLRFFHGVQRRKGEYEQFPEKFKKRMA